MAKVAIQGGVDNYLGKQPQVVAPRKWQSSPDKPETELAYITKAEKDLIIKENIHGGLEGGPNMGPSGIMSLDSFGDIGGGGQSGAQADSGRAEDRAAGDFSGVSSGSGSYESRIMSPSAAKAEQQRLETITRNQKYGGGENTKGSFNPFNFGKKYIKDRQKLAYNLSGFIPGQTKRSSKMQKAYRDYLISMGVTPPNTLTGEEDDLAEFFVENAFDKPVATDAMLQTPKTYGEFIAENFGAPGVMMSGNVGGLEKFVATRNPDGTPATYGYNNVGEGNRDGADNIFFLPFNSGEGGTGTTEDDNNEFPYRLGYGQKVGRDVRLGYAANGGRIGKAFGGIMDTATGRKRYFLGSVGDAIGDVFGGVAKAAKKVLSSDVGKMAIAGLGSYYLGGGKALGGAKMFGNTGFGTSGFMSNLGRVGTFIKENPFKSIGLASVALPFIPGINDVKQDTMPDGYGGGKMIDPLTGEEGTPASMRANIEKAKKAADGDPDKLAALNQKYNNMLFTNLPYPQYGLYSVGGRVAAQEGGLMDLGGMEKDYRAEGGFVPIGREEKADDVPARLSVNEFVFTADAVRNAGGGDIDKGAEVMENMMKNLENGGRVSEESQGNTGAQEMFSVSERIGEVI